VDLANKLTRNHFGALIFVGCSGNKDKDGPQLRQTKKTDKENWL
jgi:hypothetical protein